MNSGYMLPPRHKAIAEAIEREGNPYGRPREDRKRPYPTADPQKKGEDVYLFFGGCTAAYLIPEMIGDSLRILQAGKVPYAFLGSEEPCCGSVLFRSGYSKSAETLAHRNMKLFNRRGFSKIITICSGCYRTFKIDYPEIFGETGMKVYHISEIISELLGEGRIKLKARHESKVTYHDPCHLGVHCGVFDQPRSVIKEIYGDSYIEMVRNRKDSRCCGAGGGVKSALPEISVTMAGQRLLDATETGARKLVTSCPFCLINLRDAAKQGRNEIKIYDLAGVVAAQLIEPKEPF
jgi:heterodisulfide reductase subunit D